MYVYISADVGRLSLLILIKGQCEGLVVGISADGAFSHVFFVSIRFVDSLSRGCHQPSNIDSSVGGSTGRHHYVRACLTRTPAKEFLNIYKLTILFTLLIKHSNV